MIKKTHHFAALLFRLLHKPELLVDFLVREATELAEDLSSFGDAALADQEDGGLGHEEGEDEQDGRDGTLDGQRDAVRVVSLNLVGSVDGYGGDETGQDGEEVGRGDGSTAEVDGDDGDYNWVRRSRCVYEDSQQVRLTTAFLRILS